MIFVVTDYSSKTVDTLKGLMIKTPVQYTMFEKVRSADISEYIRLSKYQYVFLNTRSTKEVWDIVYSAHGIVDVSMVYLHKPINDHKKLTKHFKDGGLLTIEHLSGCEKYKTKPRVLSITKDTDTDQIQAVKRMFPDIEPRLGVANLGSLLQSGVRHYYLVSGELYLEGWNTPIAKLS